MRYFLLLFCFLVMSSGFGQKFKLDPAPVHVDGDAMESDVICTSRSYNLFGKPLKLRWVRIKDASVPNWKTAICDINTCYASTKDSADFDLAAGVDAQFLVHYYPDSTNGSDSVRIFLYEIGKREEGQYYSFSATLTGSVGIKENKENVANIYPNPADNYTVIQYTNNVPLEINIFNVFGQNVLRMQNINHSNRLQLDTENLPSGIYFIRSQFNHKIITNLTFIKR